MAPALLRRRRGALEHAREGVTVGTDTRPLAVGSTVLYPWRTAQTGLLFVRRPIVLVLLARPRVLRGRGRGLRSPAARVRDVRAAGPARRLVEVRPFVRAGPACLLRRVLAGL